MSEENPLWTTEQMAEFIGFPVSTVVKWRRIRIIRESVSEMVAKGASTDEINAAEVEIATIHGPKLAGPPFVRIGRKVRYRKDDVLEWARNPT